MFSNRTTYSRRSARPPIDKNHDDIAKSKKVETGKNKEVFSRGKQAAQSLKIDVDKVNSQD